MTMPHERTRAVLETRKFLEDLLSPAKTPQVPEAIRERARWCLRHYPEIIDICWSAKWLPDTWGESVEFKQTT